MLYSDFFDSADHVTLDVDQDFKEGSDIAFEFAVEHVDNLSIALSYSYLLRHTFCK